MHLRLLWILTALGLWATAPAGELPDYVRYAEDAKSSRLEVATRSLTLPSGQIVDLIGVVHIADAAYYEELNRRFEGYDSVLFELVGDPEALQAADAVRDGGGAVSTIQLSAARFLKLTFQLDVIDYRRKNMVHADTSAEEFAALQRKAGETTATLFARAMQAQLNGGLNNAAMRELDTLGLIRILMSPDSATAFKKSLAKMFDQMESMTAAMEGKEGSVILGGRNAVVVKKVGEVLANRKQRRIAVFFGGAHMPGIETSLVEKLDARITGEEWLAAWTILRTPRAGTTPAPGTAKPAS